MAKCDKLLLKAKNSPHNLKLEEVVRWLNAMAGITLAEMVLTAYTCTQLLEIRLVP